MTRGRSAPAPTREVPIVLRARVAGGFELQGAPLVILDADLRSDAQQTSDLRSR
jgi:hypothetical protein